MQRVVNILSSGAGLTFNPPNFEDLPNLKDLLDVGWKVVQIISHGFIPNTTGVLMTVILEKEESALPKHLRTL